MPAPDAAGHVYDGIGHRTLRNRPLCPDARTLSMLDHSDGNEPGVSDRTDMALLHERLGVEYSPPFRHA